MTCLPLPRANRWLSFGSLFVQIGSIVIQIFKDFLLLCMKRLSCICNGIQCVCMACTVFCRPVVERDGAFLSWHNQANTHRYIREFLIAVDKMGDIFGVHFAMMPFTVNQVHVL